MKKLTVLFSLLCVVIATQSLRADTTSAAGPGLTFELGDVFVTAGNTGVVTASVSAAPGLDPQILSTYNIALNIDDLPGFTFNEITPATTDLATFSAAPQPLLNFDYGISGSGGTIALGATPTALFNVLFDIAPDAVAGSVLPVSFEQNPGFEIPGGGFNPFPGSFSVTIDGVSANIADLGDTVVSNGSVTVTGVPEPSSLLLIMFAAGSLSFRRYRS